jgi:hypothetical protein
VNAYDGRLCMSVWLNERGSWVYVVWRGDGEEPGSALRGSGCPTPEQAVREASEFILSRLAGGVEGRQGDAGVSDDTKQTYGLLLPFDADDPEFVRGFEAGRLWEMMKMVSEDGGGFEQTIHATNAEMAMRMAEYLGVPFVADLDDAWIHLTVGVEEPRD